MKGLPLLAIAVFIDILQAGVSFGLWGVGVTAGGVLQFIPVVGTAVIPIGIILSLAITFCMSVAAAGILIPLLFFNKLFAWRPVAFGSAGEMFPGLGLLPAWTGCVLACMIIERKKSRKGSLATFAITTVPSGATPGAVAANTVREGVRHQRQAQLHTENVDESEVEQELDGEQVPSTLTNRFNDIAPRRAANDNRKQSSYVQAA